MYKVLEYFTDLQDGDNPYYPGDTFPRKGLKVSEARIAELAGPNNRRKKPLIAKEPEPEEAPALAPKKRTTKKKEG